MSEFKAPARDTGAEDGCQCVPTIDIGGDGKIKNDGESKSDSNTDTDPVGQRDDIDVLDTRDHRKIGTQQKLFLFHPWSPGACFWLPHGARIYNKLVEFMRQQYRERGYAEVITPNAFHTDLFKTSAHYDNYKQNMFLFAVEGQEFALKPMNCPGHCLMFGSTLHSYRDLPIRFADFGVLHRNEFSGALSGLTRVRRFQQDDAHIFCRPDQVESEIASVLDFIRASYAVFGFALELKLSTRPDKYVGDLQLWQQAEQQLTASLNAFGQPWSENPKDGAFYGPKIDIALTDALGRQHQCATIQLDFQLPRKFQLQYKSNTDQLEYVVMIHRAVLGSVERMAAVLMEHTGGKWPFWLSPRQICVVPVAHGAGKKHLADYAHQIGAQLHRAGFDVEVDDGTNSLNKKIREAQQMQFNFVLVVGDLELSRQTVNVRPRDGSAKYESTLPDLITKLGILNQGRT